MSLPHIFSAGSKDSLPKVGATKNDLSMLRYLRSVSDSDPSHRVEGMKQPPTQHRNSIGFENDRAPRDMATSTHREKSSRI